MNDIVNYLFLVFCQGRGESFVGEWTLMQRSWSIEDLSEWQGAPYVGRPHLSMSALFY